MTMHELVDRIRNEIPIWWAASDDEGYEVEVTRIDDKGNAVISFVSETSVRSAPLDELM